MSQGPVVQSIFNLTSSLRGQLVKCDSTLLTKTLLFLLKKLETLLTFFQQKYWGISDISI